jgi:hypothetical protein
VVKVPGPPPCDKVAATGSAISREVVAVREGEFLDILGLFFR